jgi:hypothetical protein
MRKIVARDWKKAFEPETLRAAIRYKLHSEASAAG